MQNIDIHKLEKDYQSLLEENRRLAEEVKEFRRIADNTYDMERWLSPDRKLRYISPSCQRITGYSGEEHMDNPNLLLEIVHPDDRQRFEEQLIECFEGRLSEPDLVRIKTKKGDIRWIGVAVQRVFGEDNELAGYRTSTRDMTRLKQTELKLSEALARHNDLKRQLEHDNEYLREKLLPVKENYGIQTVSPLMKEVLAKIPQVAQTDSPVLITGETGTGKELVAQAIHNTSRRSRRTLITVNCGALPAALIESELFGREKGAYTGALSRQIGRFELADGSTIFLDEVGELPQEIQVKLLRILQFGEFQMLGSPETKKVNVRIIAATNRDLKKEMEAGRFRTDLFYRLSVFPVNLPPLRERKEDIPILAWSMIDELSTRVGKHVDKISARSMKKLQQYDWPGNVRELKNLMEYSLIMTTSPVLDVHVPENSESRVHSDDLDNHQRQHIEKVLTQTGWRIRGPGGAAEKLGMKESTLRFRMKKLGIRRKK